MVESELLTPKECSEYRRCSLRKLDRERVERRGCPYVRIDGRIFYRRGDIDRFIIAHVCGGERTRAALAVEKAPDPSADDAAANSKPMPSDTPQPRRRGRPRKQPDEST